jgi:hypothetical protein
MDPITLAALSAGFDLLGSISQVNAQNQAALNNAAMARQAAAYKQDQEMESYVEYNRQMLMQAMDRALTARSNSDLAMVSMFETGGGGQVMTDMLAERRSVEARNLYRDRLERNSLKIQTNRNLQGYEQEAKGRIAQVPATSLNMGHIMSAATSGMPYLA